MILVLFVFVFFFCFFVFTFASSFSASKSSDAMEHLCHGILRSEYFVRLFEAFDVCEAEGKTEGLHALFRIFRCLLFANNVPLLELILSEEYVLKLYGCLEYDPRVTPDRYVRHRAFLSQTKLKEVVPLPSEDLRVRIRQTFYMQYLRDVVLAGVIDDAITTTINSFVVYNQMEIVSLVRRSPDIMQHVLRQLQDPDLTDSTFLEKILFVVELCSMGKMCNVAGRMELYSLLSSLGLFQVMELALRRSDLQIRASACEIVCLSMMHNVALLRGYVLSQPSSKPSFLLLLIDGVVGEVDAGLKSQYSAILLQLLDPDGMDKVSAKDQMLSTWYEACMPRLMEPLNTPVNENTATKECVLDLLEFCLKVHDFRVKYFILGNNLAKRVVAMTEHHDRHMQLQAVRIMRVFVGMRDSFFDRHIVRHHFMDPIIGLLVNNAGANNLIDSAILEMLEFIRIAPMHMLAKELVQRHRQALLDIKYVATTNQLVNLVDLWENANNSNNVEVTPPAGTDSPSRKRARNNGNTAIGADLDEAWLEDDLEDAFRKQPSQHHHQQLQRQPEELMGFSILPPMPMSTRRLMDDDDDLPLLDRHDTPPISFGPQSLSQGAPSFSFASSLRLPSEPGALVAGLAAEATRHLAESQTGGPFWESPPISPPPRLPEEEGAEAKRRKAEESTLSLVDEFLKDSL
jgi:hypothetical protein